VKDQPGVLAQVASLLGQRGIGISSVMQPEDLESTTGTTPLMLMIHDATLGQMKDAVQAIAALDCVAAEPAWMRVETLG